MVGGEGGGGALPGPIVSVMAYLQSFYSHASQSLRKELWDSCKVLAPVAPKDQRAWCPWLNIYYWVNTVYIRIEDFYSIHDIKKSFLLIEKDEYKS